MSVPTCPSGSAGLFHTNNDITCTAGLTNTKCKMLVNGERDKRPVPVGFLELDAGPLTRSSVGSRWLHRWNEDIWTQ